MIPFIYDLSMGMPTLDLVLYSTDAWLFTGFRLGALLVSNTHTHFTMYFGCHKFRPHTLGGILLHIILVTLVMSLQVMYSGSHKDFLPEKSDCCLLPKSIFLR
jgi:hypothetical protein